MIPRSGDVLRITRAASVQFSTPMLFRVIGVHDWTTDAGWIWLDGYELNGRSEAVDRRSIFVQVAGLQPVQLTPASVVPRRPAPTCAGRRSAPR